MLHNDFFFPVVEPCFSKFFFIFLCSVNEVGVLIR